MRKGLTEVVFILDRSGSMRGLEADTIGGFNSMIEKQSKEEGEAYISTVLFDDQSEVLYDRVPVGKVKPMNDNQYYVEAVQHFLMRLAEQSIILPMSISMPEKRTDRRRPCLLLQLMGWRMPAISIHSIK
mgnify:CR=1 FL=1